MLDYKTDLFVLKERDFGDFDRIVTVFTKDFGKRNIKIRGAYKVLSKLNSHVQLFSIIDVDVIYGKNLDYICHANKYKVFSTISSSFKKSIIYSFVLEVIDKITQEGLKDIEVYNLCIRYFEYLDKIKVEDGNNFFISFEKDKDLVESLHEFFILFFEANGFQIDRKYYSKNGIVDNKEEFFTFIYFYVEKFLNVEKFFK